jgi:hypothetical protein
MCALIFSPGILGQPEKCSMLLLIYRDLASNLLWCPLSRFCVAAKAVNIFHQSHGARRTPFRPKIPSLLLSQIRIFSIATVFMRESSRSRSFVFRSHQKMAINIDTYSECGLRQNQSSIQVWREKVDPRPWRHAKIHPRSSMGKVLAEADLWKNALRKASPGHTRAYFYITHGLSAAP